MSKANTEKRKYIFPHKMRLDQKIRGDILQGEY